MMMMMRMEGEMMRMNERKLKTHSVSYLSSYKFLF